MQLVIIKNGACQFELRTELEMKDKTSSSFGGFFQKILFRIQLPIFRKGIAVVVFHTRHGHFHRRLFKSVCQYSNMP